MNKKSKGELWLRCVNIGDNPSDVEIEKFLDSITMIDLQVDFLGLDWLPADGWETPTIDDYKQFHQEFMSIFHHRLKTKRLDEEEIEWINEHSLKCKNIFLSYNWDIKDPVDEIVFGARYKTVFGLDKQPILNYIAYQFGCFLESGKELRYCEAEDCRRFFVPVRKAQKWHDAKCRKRVWAQENLLKN